MHIPFDAVTHLLGIYPKDMLTHVPMMNIQKYLFIIIHLFILHILNELLLHSRSCSRQWRNNSEQNRLAFTHQELIF